MEYSHGMVMHRLIFFTLTAVFLLLSACAQGNVVRLSYPASRAPEAAGNGIRVCVVDFENKRDKIELGLRQNGQIIIGRTMVERWLAEGVAAELARAGYTTVMAETMDGARKLGPDYIVTGDAEEVWLAEPSLTRFTATVRTSITLLDGQGRDITSNNYSSVFSTARLPVHGVPQTLLDEALFEMLQPAVQLLTQAMR